MTLVSPDEQDVSIIMETMTTEHSQCVRNNPNWNWTVVDQNVTFRLAKSLKKIQKLHVWKSNLFGFWFEQQQDIIPEQVAHWMNKH